jgi:uncharacterized protein involved in type VI secretion and phage assembly
VSVPVDGDAHRHFGVYPAIVTSITDADRLGRVEVSFPWLGDSDVRAWATLCTPYADDGQGFEFMPAVDTQVVVAFEAGDVRRPYIVGSCWNGREALPETPTASNDKRLIRSRAHSRLLFDDADGAAKVTIDMESGHRVVLDDGAQEVRVAHANGATIVIDAGGAVRITANSTVEVSAPAMNVHAATATFDGIINCQTLVAEVGVVSPSYTPGAGNVW